MLFYILRFLSMQTMKVKYEREKKQILKNEGKREGASIVV